MADYFTNFSLIVSLPTEAAKKYALDLVEQVERIHHGQEPTADFPASLKDVVDDWHFDTVSDHSSDGHDLCCTPAMAVSTPSAPSSKSTATLQSRGVYIAGVVGRTHQRFAAGEVA